MADDGQRRDPAKIAFYGGLLVVAFGWGLATAAFHVFPYEPLRWVWASAQTLRVEIPTLLGTEPSRFLEPARHDGDGATSLARDRAAPGLTLLTGFFDGSNELRLVELDGTVLRRWPVAYSEIFPEPDHIQPESRRPATDWNIDIHGALARPDGSVVFSFEYGGLAALGRCGAVLWTLPRMTHHFVVPAGDGDMLVGQRRWIQDRGEGATTYSRSPHAEDQLLRVSGTGRVLEELSIEGLLVENGLLPVLTANGNHSTHLPSDLAHLNDAEPLPDSLADRFPAFDAGDLLISLRHLNMILVFDPRTRRIKWRQTGPWIRQHDPDFSARGTITVFDNRTGDRDAGSRILEVDPTTGAVDVAYDAPEPSDFYARVRGRHERLANGNLLIVDHKGGRVFEVDSAGTLTWEYVNRYDDTRVARINDAIRYPHDYFAVDDWACD